MVDRIKLTISESFFLTKYKYAIALNIVIVCLMLTFYRNDHIKWLSLELAKRAKLKKKLKYVPLFFYIVYIYSCEKNDNFLFPFDRGLEKM